MSEAYKEHDGLIDGESLIPQDDGAETSPAVLDAELAESGVANSLDLNESVDYSEMGPEDFETLETSEMVTADTEPVFNAAFENDAKQNSRAYALANVLYAADPELEAEFEADVTDAVASKQREDQPSAYTKFSDWVGKHSKKFVAATALVGGMSSLPAMAQGNQGFNVLEWGKAQVGRVQEVGNVQEQINANKRTIAMHEATIQTLEAQKAAIAAQNNATQEVGTVGMSAETSARFKEIEANHKAQRAEFRAQKSTLKQQLLSNPNATEADQDRYDAAIARVEAAEAREEGEYQKALAATRTSPALQSAQLGVQGGYANQQYVQLSAQQNQLRGEIRRLNLANQQLRLGVVSVITR